MCIRDSRQTDAPDRAFAKLKQALEKIGNNPQATGFSDCIQELSNHPRYTTFLNDTLQTANDHPTLESRIKLATARQLQAAKKPYQSEVIILDMASRYERSDLPEECLAHVGLKLAEIHSEQANDFLDDLLIRYPNSEYKPFAHYGYALQAERKNDSLTTLAWLDLISPSSYQAPFYLDALLLKGDILLKTGEHLQATEIYQSILALRWARGLHKATALSGLANSSALQDKNEEAIIYHQRIYTLYPAYEKLASNSYLASAQLFLEIGDPTSAERTCRDFLKQERFAANEHYLKIQALLKKSQTQLPTLSPPQP